MLDDAVVQAYKARLWRLLNPVGFELGWDALAADAGGNPCVGADRHGRGRTKDGGAKCNRAGGGEGGHEAQSGLQDVAVCWPGLRIAWGGGLLLWGVLRPI